MNMEKLTCLLYLIERSIHLQIPDSENIVNFDDINKTIEYFNKNEDLNGLGEVSFLKALSYIELIKKKLKMQKGQQQIKNNRKPETIKKFFNEVI